MCYIFNCFGWLLDLIQRIITFFLACWMAYAICIGLTVAAVAGIAYGYNYSLAEFLTFARSDVTVYMRRGQFYDRPDIVESRNYRRSGEDDLEEEELPPNLAFDYEEHKKQRIENKAAPLSDSWQKAQDTRKYAERLVKYEYTPSHDQDFEEAMQMETSSDHPPASILIATAPSVYYKLTTLPVQITNLISITPKIVMSTTLLQSGSSEIVMRNFQPIEEVLPSRTPSSVYDYGNEDYSNKFGQMDVFEDPPKKMLNKHLPKAQYVLRERPTLSIPQTELKNILENVPKSYHMSKNPIPMRHWTPGDVSLLKKLPEENTYRDR